MSLLARAKLSARGGRFFVHSIIPLQQFNFYSTKTTPFTPKTQRSTSNTKTLKPSQSPSLSERVKNQTGSMIDWPKPIEIPYQAKVANSVNLIGRVKAPVQFDSASDENPSAAAVIFQENGHGNNSLLIPVVFEGDLAHVVACHVKENDRVYVSGQLSESPTRFAFNESVGKFHLVAENLNFVDGFPKNVHVKKSSVVTPFAKKTEEVVKNDDVEFNQKWKEALENAKDKKFSGESDWTSRPVLKQTYDEADNGKSVVESVKPKKNGDSGLDLWRDLVKSPHQWWDYRDHKSNGLVKEKYPDFKHKETGDGIWVDSAPDWVLPGLGKLEFDVKFMKPKPVAGGEGFGEKKEFGVKFTKGKGKGEESWKSLVDNPSKWWDNRLDKRNPRAPDFKNKETGEGLWLSNSPDWAMSGLPQLRDGKKNNM
ncbi:protein osb2 chloroplastic [Phtheirospermum japonicum]|uniref:Protein osb2 chloroplastic n=1 Tax=Phtheirospermum japonicum TaxID=374723 RepID=A0A830CVI1_9LAMI|nr:protein osb2 chloroplastic [Phtheirospermum japonicum]